MSLSRTRTIKTHNLYPRIQPSTHNPFPSTPQTTTILNDKSQITSLQTHFKSLLKTFSSKPKQLTKIHALLLTTGISYKNGLLTMLLESLTLLGDMRYARNLFDEMPKPRIYLWNTLIRGYVRNEQYGDAVSIYQKMQQIGVKPDKFTYPFVFKACSELDAIQIGTEIHAVIFKFGVAFDKIVQTELMIMYAKFGDLGSADSVFESIGIRDLVAWNALIAVYAQNGHAQKALALFQHMDSAGVKPDSITLVSVISSCAFLGCLEIGKQIHRSIIDDKFEKNVFVDNALLSMYTKCGSMETAIQLFDEMPERNVVSWSTMISGYAINGRTREALALFSQMEGEEVKPNHVSFLAVLTACSHAGLVEEGWKYFNQMVLLGKNLQPRIEHYACMVDILGRSGYLEEAYDFIKKMPVKPDSGVWGALLGACAIHHDIKLGQHIADLLFDLEPKLPSYYVLLSNIYASAGRWEDVANVRRRMKYLGVKKVASYSSLELNSKVHLFHQGDRSHPQSKRIYEELEKLGEPLRSLGYVPKTSVVLHDVEVEEKEVVVGTHSEKLAIVFGLINTGPEAPIRVMKNLRTCDDCHTFSKLLSRIVGREIVMRDKSHFHHFRDGFCSCNDFW